MDHAPQQQCCSHEQCGAQRHLRDHEDAARPAKSATRWGRRRGPLERIAGRMPWRLHRADDTERQSRQHRETDGEQQRQAIHARRGKIGQLLRSRGNEEAEPDPANQQAAQASGHRQQQALGEQLAEEPSGAGAKSCADRHFPLPSRGARE